jgi:hypothetical protein
MTFTRFAVLCAALCFSAVASAAEPSMTKIVSQMSGPRIVATNPASKPKTVYLAGTKYCRVEEEPDALNFIQNLLITNEPDFWIINLADRTGRHSVDEGPTFDVHVPIFWGFGGKPDKNFPELEYGAEAAFFSKERAREVEPRTIDGRDCRVLSINGEESEVRLMLDRKTGLPVQMDLLGRGRVETTVRYLSYTTDLPFDPSLFQPPKGIEIRDRE